MCLKTEEPDRFALYHFESRHFGAHDYRIEYDADWTEVTWKEDAIRSKVGFRLWLGTDKAEVLARYDVNEDIGELIGLLFDLEEFGDLVE